MDIRQSMMTEGAMDRADDDARHERMKGLLIEGSAEIERLTAELRDARMQALADGAQWQDDVDRLTAEHEAAVAAAYEAAATCADEHTHVMEPREIGKSLRALATDTQRDALAEHSRRMKAEGMREAVGSDADEIEQAISDVLHEGGSWRDAAEYIRRTILARADEIDQGETA